MSDRFKCLKPNDNTFRKTDFKIRLKMINRHTNSRWQEVKTQIKNLTVLLQEEERVDGVVEEEGEGEETLEIIDDLVPVKNFIIFKKMKKVAQ